MNSSMESLKPLERPVALGDQVYAALRERLRDGRIRPEQRLQEESLAATLGVSRTPVREALGRLASEGLVISDGRSFIVPAHTNGDIEEIYHVRELLEPEALRLVAESRPDARARAPLHDALDAMAFAHRSADAKEFSAANARFRSAWLALVPNRRMVRLIELYADHVWYLRALTLSDAVVREVVARGLRRVLTAVAAGDGRAAAQAMREHLEAAKRSLRRAVGLNGNAGVEPA
jgi:DNA-binding GntR family transcriptional regulator